MKALRLLLLVAAIAATEIALAIFFWTSRRPTSAPSMPAAPAFLAGQSLCAGDAQPPNLNPPFVTVAVFGPLALLPTAIAVLEHVP